MSDPERSLLQWASIPANRMPACPNSPHLTVENSFLSRARYPKGKRRLQAILDATYDIVISEGLAAASQEAIAKRAERDAKRGTPLLPHKGRASHRLLLHGHRASASTPRQNKLAEVGQEPARAAARERVPPLRSDTGGGGRLLLRGRRVLGTQSPPFRDLRDAWYQTLERHYVELIKRIHPEWDKQQCNAASLQVLTLILGGWVTMGSSRPVHRRRSRTSLKLMLLRGIERVID